MKPIPSPSTRTGAAAVTCGTAPLSADDADAFSLDTNNANSLQDNACTGDFVAITGRVVHHVIAFEHRSNTQDKEVREKEQH